nr:alpha/beta fold hydrolase [uncultured Flavobacterium sp.]
MRDTANEPSLHYLVRQPKIKIKKPPLIILLHGVGSNEQNMFSFADALPDKYKVVSVRGPLTFGNGSYAWFQVQFGANGSIINEEQAENARKEIIMFIEDLNTVEEFDLNQVYLMGFSQGGIMSYSVALTEPEKVKGIAVMSGRLLPEIKPLVVSEGRLKKVRIFVSHGKQDPVLKYGYAEDAVTYLESMELQPDFHTYNEVHTINKQMLDDVNLWLNKN